MPTKNIRTKSQSALEFLATYGWAFLAILVVIAALEYFQIISPSKLFPNKCSLGSIDCIDYAIYKNGLQLRLKNTLGESVIVDGVLVLTGRAALSCNSTAIGSVWGAGDIKEVHILCDDSLHAELIQNEKEKLSLKITYHSVMSGSSYSKEVNGDVYTIVQGALVPSTALAALWNFDEGSGTSSSDLSGNKNDVSIFNGAEWTTGKSGRALSFDGLEAFAEITDSPSLDIQNAGTIEAWINLRELTGTADQNMIVNKDAIMYEIAVHDNTGPNDGIHTCGKSTDQIPAYNFVFYFCGLSGLPNHNCGWKDGGGPISKNTWTHVAVTYDGSAVRTYINGIIQKEYTSVSGTVCTNDHPVRIGARDLAGGVRPPPQTNYGALFNGVIDEVKIYNRALTAEEILKDSNI